MSLAADQQKKDSRFTFQKTLFSNWEIIQSATINPSKILDTKNNFGSIAVVKKADLFLLDANPFEDLNNLSKINLVINEGEVINTAMIIK